VLLEEDGAAAPSFSWPDGLESPPDGLEPPPDGKPDGSKKKIC
jgi:hypothetical protein